MKRFAILISMAILLVSCTACAYAINLSIQMYPLNEAKGADTEVEDNEQAHFETEEVSDGKLTLELISQMSSWDELVKTAVPLSNDYRNIENYEDRYSVTLISGINNKHLSVPIYHDELYIAHGLGGIDLEKIDFDRMMNKFIAIINLYNTSGDLYLMWDYKVLSSGFMQIDVHSTNYIWMCNPAKEVGQSVVVMPNAKYFESAWNNGSGKFGIVTFPDSFDIVNDIVPENYIFTVNGVAYLDENWERVLESYYTPYSELGENEPEITIWERRMLHICTEDGDYGWINAEDVMRIEDVRMF